MQLVTELKSQKVISVPFSCLYSIRLHIYLVEGGNRFKKSVYGTNIFSFKLCLSNTKHWIYVCVHVFVHVYFLQIVFIENAR